eukprot:1179164-Prorocentrum_minimum.AAC.3
MSAVTVLWFSTSFLDLMCAHSPKQAQHKKPHPTAVKQSPVKCRLNTCARASPELRLLEDRPR